MAKLGGVKRTTRASFGNAAPHASVRERLHRLAASLLPQVDGKAHVAWSNFGRETSLVGFHADAHFDTIPAIQVLDQVDRFAHAHAVNLGVLPKLAIVLVFDDVAALPGRRPRLLLRDSDVCRCGQRWDQ